MMIVRPLTEDQERPLYAWGYRRELFVKCYGPAPHIELRRSGALYNLTATRGNQCGFPEI